MRKRYALGVASVVFAALAAPFAAAPSQTTIQLEGSVKSTTGEPVSNGQISLTDPTSRRSRADLCVDQPFLA